MENSQKLENLLNLALETPKKEREKSQALNVGYEEESGKWELIVRYHGSADRLRELPGTQVETLLGGYAVVWTPQEQIDVIAAMEEVEYVEKPKWLLYGVETGRAASCIDSVQQELPETLLPADLWEGEFLAGGQGSAAGAAEDLSGRGVLIGILDSGIDYTLPDFCWADGSSRILGLWDQTLSLEFTKEQIDAALAAPNAEERERLVPSRDLSGHGTAVACLWPEALSGCGAGQRTFGRKTGNAGGAVVSEDNGTDARTFLCPAQGAGTKPAGGSQYQYWKQLWFT